MPRKPKAKRKPSSELRRLREESGLTLDELATLSGLDRSTIHVAEQGTRKTRASTRNRLTNTIARFSHNGLPHNHIERLMLAAERIADALEKPTKHSKK